AGRHVDDHVRLPVGGGLDETFADGVDAERDRAVAARRGVAVLVPEQRAEVRAGVVGRYEEAAVHVGVAARLVHQQLAEVVDVGGIGAAFQDGGARDGGDAAGDDPERLARRVVVDGGDGHSSKPSGNGSRGSRKYWAVPVIQARPVMDGTTAGLPPTLVSSRILPVKRVPMNDSLTKSRPT